MILRDRFAFYDIRLDCSNVNLLNFFVCVCSSDSRLWMLFCKYISVVLFIGNYVQAARFAGLNKEKEKTVKSVSKLKPKTTTTTKRIKCLKEYWLFFVIILVGGAENDGETNKHAFKIKTKICGQRLVKIFQCELTREYLHLESRSVWFKNKRTK